MCNESSQCESLVYIYIYISIYVSGVAIVTNRFMFVKYEPSLSTVNLCLDRAQAICFPKMDKEDVQKNPIMMSRMDMMNMIGRAQKIMILMMDMYSDNIIPREDMNDQV